MHRLTGDGQSAFHFRADGNQVEVFSEGFCEKQVEFVLPVIADLITQETGADPDLDFLFYFNPPLLSSVL
jgi:hypothetical protein